MGAVDDRLDVFNSSPSWIDLGLIVVVYTEPEEGVVRIMSAREATHRERSLFRNYMDGTR